MILIVAMLIQASLQFLPGIFLLFHHDACGKYGQARARDLGAYLILGAGTMMAIVMTTVFLISPDIEIVKWGTGGALVALSLVSLGFYFRKGEGTRLYVSRRTVRILTKRARETKSLSDAFVLGMVASTVELVFLLPVYFAVVIEAGKFYDHVARAGILIIVGLAGVLPLILESILFRSGLNLVDVQKIRARNKHFCRIMLGVCYITLAVLVISSGRMA